MATGNATIVQALAALAGALSPSAQTNFAPGTASSQTTAIPTHPGPQASTSGGLHSARDILPSYLKRKSTRGGNRSKKPNTEKTWDRDVVCLPMSKCNHAKGLSFSFPRGRYRAELGQQGLIGKLHISSSMTEEQVGMEIRSIFKGPMKNDPSFPFSFLQSTGGGSKLLSIPSVSSSFRWNAQQVARLATQKGSIYILAQAQLELSQDVLMTDSSNSEEEDDRSVSVGSSAPPAQQSSVQVTQSTQSHRDAPQPAKKQTHSGLYRQYVDLIDLTTETSGEDTDIDDSLLPPLVISPPERKSDMRCDTIKLKHILQQHQRRVITAQDEEDFQRIHVRRSCIFHDAYKQFCKLTFAESKVLKVTFVGEQAVDDGGPRREFFKLLLNEIFTKSGLFSGAPDHIVPLHSVEAVTNNKFLVIGKMLATCLIQGGQAPACFAKAVADFLVYDSVRSPVCLEDIADYEVRSHLQKVASVTTTEQLRSLLATDNFNFLFYCGYSKSTVNAMLEDKEDIIRSVWLHFVFFHPHAELEQLRKGFRESLQVELLICQYSDEAWWLLASSSSFDVTVDHITDSFAVAYSDNGSNDRTKEEAIVFFWYEYISEASAPTGREGVTIADILQFYSGADKIPAIGFDATPKIGFTSDECLPRVSTCDLSITFPRSMGLLSFDKFAETMDMCIQGSFGFGTV